MDISQNRCQEATTNLSMLSVIKQNKCNAPEPSSGNVNNYIDGTAQMKTTMSPPCSPLQLLSITDLPKSLNFVRHNGNL